MSLSTDSSEVVICAIISDECYFAVVCAVADIATVNFDRSGTTVIGKYLLNHSFMMPGLVSVGVATLVSMLLARLLY